jgi:hypothetical protein
MYFEHSPAIWAAFPALVPGVLGVDDVRPDAVVAPRLEPLFARARLRLSNVSQSELPEIQAE